MPSPSRYCFTCAMENLPLWNTLAARTPRAPAFFTASAKWASSPAPPEAMTGRGEASAAMRVASRSYPVFAPSCMVVSRISPAPQSASWRIHGASSLPEGFWPAPMTSYSPAALRNTSTSAVTAPGPYL